LLAGQVQVMFDTVSTSIEHIRAGRLRPLAVTAATPWEAFAGIPSVGAFISGYEATGWIGVGAPKNTPDAVVEVLNKVALADPKNKARIADLASVPLPMTPAQFGRLIADETEKWGKVIRAAHIKAE
jgi:tripartite-type tricarboxylate transporter receptor subunit TctC